MTTEGAYVKVDVTPRWRYLDPEQGPLWECLTCGSVVQDRAIHGVWHFKSGEPAAVPRAEERAAPEVPGCDHGWSEDYDATCETGLRSTAKGDHQAEAFKRGWGPTLSYGWHCLTCDDQREMPSAEAAQAAAEAHVVLMRTTPQKAEETP